MCGATCTDLAGVLMVTLSVAALILHFVENP